MNWETSWNVIFSTEADTEEMEEFVSTANLLPLLECLSDDSCSGMGYWLYGSSHLI